MGRFEDIIEEVIPTDCEGGHNDHQQNNEPEKKISWWKRLWNWIKSLF